MPGKKLLSISVEESAKTRHYWASRPSLQESTIRKILSSEVLIVPWENRSGTGDTFPEGTSDFTHRLSKTLGQGKVALAIEQADYQELSLHADRVYWPTMAIASIMFGVFAGVIANEITALIRQPKPPETLEMKLIVENASGVCISIDYQGPPLRALETIVAEAKTCFPEEIEYEPELEAMVDDDKHDAGERK
ncbi:MAG: hypothetical protein OXE44_07050 [Nitrospinae bacterium]|nr:hypothetical protein [Nitrospinota bacterium]